ncbi:hypothetical protein MUK72_08570 [Halococcus dombrowskii]|uniref:Uncharacterized protein n=1 Tax=Halococcus dombrowskii TaxID=179637 RepID=A0AAV3SES6_HALDO|nr:hypothetical protein [Halococcus dombrowskii]UOO94024.1 hypothetical protein MUK72_08570 [Halococcus dombrowskii]
MGFKSLWSPESVWHGVSTLLIEKFSGDEVTVRTTDETVVVSLGGRSHELGRDAAASLRRALDGALAEHHTFVHTVGTHRSDGSYVVARRGADSSGHRKVFDRFDELRQLYESLPERFTADDIEQSGLTGSRRHLVVRHLAEHPGFGCALVARQPLTGAKDHQR